jgi:hypothetical protein
MRIFLMVIAAFVAVACSETNDGDSAPKVCSDLSDCLSSGTWVTDVESFHLGQLVQTAGDGGVVLFNKNNTGTTTEAFLQGYANSVYYSAFTYTLDEVNFTLTISYDIPPTNPTQSEVFAITSAYENQIRMERPIIDGKLVFILTK